MPFSNTEIHDDAGKVYQEDGLPPISEEDLLRERLLKFNEVCRITNMGKTTIWRLTKEGKFPQPIRFSKRLVRWRLTVIERWLKDPMNVRGP